MKAKRILAVLAVATLLCAALAGCGGTSDPAPESPGQESNTPAESQPGAPAEPAGTESAATPEASTGELPESIPLYIDGDIIDLTRDYGDASPCSVVLDYGAVTPEHFASLTSESKDGSYESVDIYIGDSAIFVGGAELNASRLATALDLSQDEWDASYGTKQYGPGETEFIQCPALTIGAYSESEESVDLWGLLSYFIQTDLDETRTVYLNSTEIHGMQDMEAVLGMPAVAYVGDPSLQRPVYVWKCLGFYILAEFDGTGSGAVYAVRTGSNLDNLMKAGNLDKNVFPDNWYETLNFIGLYGEIADIT